MHIKVNHCFDSGDFQYELIVECSVCNSPYGAGTDLPHIMLSPEESKNCKDLLRILPSSDILSLCETVTNRLVAPTTSAGNSN